MRRLADLALRGLARLSLGLFYRRVEIVGRDRLPATGPTLYVGNHGNGIIDPALVLGWFPAGIRFLAKSTLWRQFPMALFVRLAGAVKVFRQIDPGVDPSRNRDMFADCWRTLGRRGALCLFPEGISHAEPHLMPLKTGAARIALGALARHRALGLVVVPFGLVFEERQRFRSRVLIEVGRPIDPRPWLTPGGETDRESVRALTHAIERALAAVTLNFPSWEEADLVRRAASLYVADEVGPRPGGRLAEHLPFQRAFADGYAEIRRRHPEETRRVRRELEHYARLLDLTGLSDHQVASEYPPTLVARFLLRAALDLLLLLPAGLLGAVLHWLPYKIPRWTVRLLPLDRDQHASYKLMISLFLFPVFWGLGAYWLWRLGGWGIAAPFLVAAPLCGYVALRLKERLERLVDEARAYLVLRGEGSPARRLKARRGAVLESLRRLVETYNRGGSEERISR